MNNTVVDTIKTNDSEVIFLWHPGKTIDNLKSFQVYGFCLNDKGKVCLVKDKKETRFTLPGGHVDDEETAKEALIREFEGEAQFIPENIELLGSLEVKVVGKDSQVIDHHQQVRFVCKIHNIPNFVAGKDGWETEERIFVDPNKLPDYIDWLSYPTGKAQFEDFLKYLDK
ncbi:NUDIX hydrolase [Candidatus Shapirobacteria bacterium]|nr:NUDIX hydrolase [Candidatus Shapirobacteria bacterium]